MITICVGVSAVVGCLRGLRCLWGVGDVGVLHDEIRHLTFGRGAAVECSHFLLNPLHIVCPMTALLLCTSARGRRLLQSPRLTHPVTASLCHQCCTKRPMLCQIRYGARKQRGMACSLRNTWQGTRSAARAEMSPVPAGNIAGAAVAGGDGPAEPHPCAQRD